MQNRYTILVHWVGSEFRKKTPHNNTICMKKSNKSRENLQENNILITKCTKKRTIRWFYLYLKSEKIIREKGIQIPKLTNNNQTSMHVCPPFEFNRQPNKWPNLQKNYHNKPLRSSYFLYMNSVNPYENIIHIIKFTKKLNKSMRLSCNLYKKLQSGYHKTCIANLTCPFTAKYKQFYLHVYRYAKPIHACIPKIAWQFWR